MSKTIQVREILNIEGRPIRIPDRNADGDIAWSETCPVCNGPETGTQPKLVDLDTVSAIRSLIFQMPQQIRKPDDPQMSYRVMEAVRQMKDDKLVLEDADYEWLHRLMNREIPLGDDAPSGAIQETMATALWAMNSWVVVEQMSEQPAIELQHVVQP